MKTRTIHPQFSLSVLLLASAIAAMSPARAAQDGEEHYAKGRILIEVREGVTAADFDNVMKPMRGKPRKMGQSNIQIIDLPVGFEKQVIAQLKKNPFIKFAELDRRVPIAAVLNDPNVGSQWHHTKIGSTTAWDSAQGTGVTVAILDTGVDASHPDLASRLVPGWDIYTNSADTSDLCGHGTAVAGSAAAAGNNGVGVSGVAGQARIMPLRVAYRDATSGQCYAYQSTIANAVTYAADRGVKVVNISFANSSNSAAVQSAANYLKSKGGLVFTAANNYNRDEGFAPTTSLIAVAATDSADNKSSFSSYGNFVSLSSPGTGIYTTSKGGTYGSWSGTSFAAPVAAGVAALVMSANPSLTADQVQNILFTTAKDLGTAGRDPYFGYGRVNAAGAVAAARGSAPAPDTAKPVVSIAAPLANSTVSGTVPVSVNASDNVGVSRVELKVNSTVVASDISAPFSFGWDSKGVANGMNTVTAIAYDAAGNVATSVPVSVNVANTTTVIVADTVRPTVRITNPAAGRVSGTVNVSVSASDNLPTSGLTLQLYVDNVLKASGTGSTMSYAWAVNKEVRGTHYIKAVARDKAGNTSTYTVSVLK